MFSSVIHYRALPLTALHCAIRIISTNSANLSIVMRQHHVYLEINEALPRVGAARVTNIFIVSHHHFSRCFRPNLQNMTLCCPSPHSYGPDKGLKNSWSPDLPATLCCLHLNRWLHLYLHLAITPSLVIDRKHTAAVVRCCSQSTFTRKSQYFAKCDKTV